MGILESGRPRLAGVALEFRSFDAADAWVRTLKQENEGIEIDLSMDGSGTTSVNVSWSGLVPTPVAEIVRRAVGG